MTVLRLLRGPQVYAPNGRTGEPRSTLYAKIAKGLFPPPVPLSERAVAWPEHEVSALVAARIAGQDESQIRALVSSLLAQRAHALDALQA